MLKKIILILSLLFITVINAQDKLAPNFELENIDGDFVTLSDYKGEKTVLLSFWATWCKPCVEEMKEYKKLYEEYKNKGFEIIAISVDNEKSVSKVTPFAKSHGYDFPVVFDTNQEVARKYYVQTVPHSILINKEGSIVYSHSGYKKGDEIKIKELLKELL